MIELVDDNIILFDSENLSLDEIDIKNHKSITLEQLASEYSNLPILSVNDWILTSMTHKLPKLVLEGISSYMDLVGEYYLIQAKKSNKSRSIRELVVNTYNTIQKCESKET